MTNYQEAVDCTWNYECKETDTEVSIRREGDVLKISFKGSTSDLDWRQNLWFIKKSAKKIYPYRDMKHRWKCHGGIFEKYKSVKDHLIETTRAHIEMGITKVEVYGFSQGGLLAILHTENHVYHFGTSIECHAFDPPRGFGWLLPKEVKRRFNTVIVYKIKGSIVSKLPPFIFGFRHVGKTESIPCSMWPWPWNWERIHMSLF